MTCIMKNKIKYMFLTLAALLLLCLPAVGAEAEATDEIKDFTVTVDVREDASLQMTYHIDWEVLDDSIGQLEWIDLGVPNSHHENITPLSGTIDHIEDNGSKLAIYLDRGYGEGETVSLDFSMDQDNMYQIDKYTEGETVYSFTPAWFDSMDVDQLTIRWNGDKAISWQPDCLQEDGYLVFNGYLPAGEKYTMSVTYPNEAFGFSVDRQAGSGDSDSEDATSDAGYVFLGLAFFALMVGVPVYMVYRFIRWIIDGLSFGFTGSTKKATEKKITRTKIEYYETCPGCGAPREEGKDKCAYCGRSMIKSKEVVEENQIENPEKYSRKGTYPYGNSGNTFIHVNVVNVPVSRPRSSYRPHSRPSSGSGRGRSSGGSSCACACASSCACACACASSGRAGCSVKDFYRDSIHKGRIRVQSGEITSSAQAEEKL